MAFPSWDADIRSTDLTDPSLHSNFATDEMFSRARREAPISWQAPAEGRSGFWSFTRHADCVRVLSDPALTSVRRGNVIDTTTTGGDSAAGRMLAVSDGARHAQLRRVIWRHLGPQAAERYQGLVLQAYDRLLAPRVGAGEFDFAGEVAASIPIIVMRELIGFPVRDQAELQETAARTLAGDDADRGGQQLARAQVLLYFSRLVKRSTSEVSMSDLVRDLSGAGLELSIDDLALNLYSILLGGDETTKLSLAGAMVMFSNDHVLEKVKDPRVPISTIVDEILRWTSPALHVARVVDKPFESDAGLHQRDEVMVFWLCSANRDENVFSRPDRIDVTRTSNKHLSFSHGRHRCVGYLLACIEIERLVGFVRDRVSRVRLVGRPTPVLSNFLHGSSSVLLEVN